MPSSDSHMLYTTITITQLRSFYNFLRNASNLDSTIYLQVDKNGASISATSIKLNPSILPYADVHHTIDSISTYKEPRATFFGSNFIGENSAIQNWWDGGGVLRALFNARELMAVIKMYAIENDTAIRLNFDCQLDPDDREYWAISTGINSDQISAIYGKPATVRCSSFDKSIDNGYHAYHNMHFYMSLLNLDFP